jgi:molybdopterin-guanine dinucleotide biosynthesis protein A
MALHHGPVVSGAVLAGGAGRRLGGVDKALVEVAGRPMAALAARALRDAGASEVLAIGGRSPGRLAALGLTPVADRWPGDGPLGGIVTALGAASAAVVVVLACDLARVDAVAVRAVVGALQADRGERFDAAMPPGEPLCAAYRRWSLEVLEAAFTEGERSPRRAVARLRVAHVEVDPAVLRSVNRPDDLR